jgi:cell division septation protein DedD
MPATAGSRSVTRCISAQVRSVTATVFGLMTISAAGFAQSTGIVQDSLSARIQLLVSRGDATAARRVVDSVLAHSVAMDQRYGDALYWRARLVSSADSSRRDLLQFIVDYPVSPRMEDALIRLADAELRSGDRASARRHLEWMARDHMISDQGVRAARQLADLMFADGAAMAACDVLDSARARVSPGNVELANQLAYGGRTCEQVRIPIQPLVTHKAERVDSAPPSRLPPARAGGRSSRQGTEWSVQVAAYGVRGDALRLAARLSARGYDTRITADKPYRVRIGRFADRAAAVEIVARLKGENTTAIIVEAERK